MLKAHESIGVPVRRPRCPRISCVSFPESLTSQTSLWPWLGAWLSLRATELGCRVVTATHRTEPLSGEGVLGRPPLGPGALVGTALEMS